MNTEEQILSLLQELKIPHYSCGDEWYNCPKHIDGCPDPDAGSECRCGADEHNANVDRVISLLYPTEEPDTTFYSDRM